VPEIEKGQYTLTGFGTNPTTDQAGFDRLAGCIYSVFMSTDVQKKSSLPVLITGGAGFLGSNLALRLVPDRPVRLLDNYTRNSLPYLDGDLLKNADRIKGDACDPTTVGPAIEGVDSVVHMAAIAGVSNYYNSPFEVMRVNLGTTMTLLTALKTHPVKRLIYVSTSEVYGTQADRVTETAPLQTGDIHEMRWTYAVSKIASEKACAAFSKQTDCPVVIVRPFNIYGPGQTGEGAIRDMIHNALRNKPIIVHGDGSQVRAWCHVDDFTECMMAALSAPTKDARVFNIGNPDSACTIEQLALLITDLCGSSAEVRFEPHFGTDIMYRTPDISAAKNALGFSPTVSLEKGLLSTIDWMRRHDL
jgi:UDP-glucose 4-epimerase